MRTHEGCFSDVTNIAHDGSAASWTACNGWALWAMAEHARLANDPAWLTAHKQAILDGCQWILRERNFSKEKPDNPCRGLLYGKFVCDMPDAGNVKGVGYFAYSRRHQLPGSARDGPVALRVGTSRGRRPAEGSGELPAGHRRRHRPAHRQVDRSLVRSLGAARAEVSRTSISTACAVPINLAFGRVLSRDDPRIAHVIRWNIDHIHKGSPEDSATANMFYSQDLAIILLEQGRVEDFLRMFYTVLASNVSHQTLTTCEWRNNTQPHVHSISSLIRMLRTMMVAGAGRRAVSPARDAAALAGGRQGDRHPRAAHLVWAAFAALRFPRRQRRACDCGFRCPIDSARFPFTSSCGCRRDCD